jgi:hypothetical protein
MIFRCFNVGAANLIASSKPWRVIALLVIPWQLIKQSEVNAELRIRWFRPWSSMKVSRREREVNLAEWPGRA